MTAKRIIRKTRIFNTEQFVNSKKTTIFAVRIQKRKKTTKNIISNEKDISTFAKKEKKQTRIP